MKKWENPEIVSLRIKATFESQTTEDKGDFIWLNAVLPDGSIADEALVQGTHDGSGPMVKIPWNEHQH